MAARNQHNQLPPESPKPKERRPDGPSGLGACFHRLILVKNYKIMGRGCQSQERVPIGNSSFKRVQFLLQLQVPLLLGVRVSCSRRSPTSIPGRRKKVSYQLLLFFYGMFITVDGFNKTSIPSVLWEFMEPYTRIDTLTGMESLPWRSSSSPTWCPIFPHRSSYPPSEQLNNYSCSSQQA